MIDTYISTCQGSNSGNTDSESWLPFSNGCLVQHNIPIPSSSFVIYIYIIIIIMSCHWHGYPWPSLATFPYRSSPLAGLQGYILYPHIAAECMFVLVILLLPGHMWGSIRVHHLWVHLCFSSSVLHVWFI